MKIAILGKGKMGKEVERLAFAGGHMIVPMAECSVCIDFSHRDAVCDHVRQAAALNKNIVIGTTDWEDKKDEVFSLSKDIGLFYSPNFSLGVFFFSQIVKEAAKLLSGYDAAGLEVHHREKVDRPSGTAKALAGLFPEGFAFESMRVGHNPGMHSITFDSLCDTVTLTHQAKNREGFALGSIRAAEWLEGKKGVFTMEDLCLKG